MSLNFFHEIYLYCMLDINASYHCMQFQGKLTKQSWKKVKKPSFGTNNCGQNLGPKLFSKILPLLVVRCCCKLSLYEKKCTKLEKMAKNLVSGRNLCPKFFPNILPLLHLRHCCKLPLHMISRKTNKQHLIKW